MAFPMAVESTRLLLSTFDENRVANSLSSTRSLSWMPSRLPHGSCTMLATLALTLLAVASTVPTRVVSPFTSDVILRTSAVIRSSV